MITKKSKRANLEDKRVIFIEIGFIIALLICLTLLEWESPTPASQMLIVPLGDMEFEEEVIPVTRQEKTESRPMDAIVLKREELSKAEGKLAGPNIMRIVSDDTEVGDELHVGDQEADQTTQVATVDINKVVLAEEEQEEEFFFIVEEMPKFNGGDLTEFQKYVQQNLVYPEEAKDNNISGIVIVQFIVNKEGKVTKAKVVRSVDPALDKEALRVINSSPRWTPGKQRNLPANVAYNFPVRFVIIDRMP